MDCIKGLSMSYGKDTILVVVDKLTKYAHFIRVRKTNSTKETTEAFWKNVYKLHGFPKIIVSDKDAKFKGNFFERIFQTNKNFT